MKKTKATIKAVKESNTENFEILIANLKVNNLLTNAINIPLQEESKQIKLPRSEPWDQWIIEKEPNSSDSVISSLASESESIIDIDKILREVDSDSSTDYGDLENSTKSSRQQFNHHISRTPSNDSGICSGQVTPKRVSTNSFDDESDDEELDNNLFNECNNLVDTVPLVLKSTLKLNFF